MSNTKHMTAAFFAAATRTFQVRLVRAKMDGEQSPAVVAFDFVRDGLCEQGLPLKFAAMVAHAAAEFTCRECGQVNHTDADMLDGFRAAIA